MLRVKSDKSDWPRIRDECSENWPLPVVAILGADQNGSAASGDENALNLTQNFVPTAVCVDYVTFRCVPQH